MRELETALGHTFADRSLLETALTHRSYTAEHPGTHNERLEFLGDAVLGLAITEAIYRRFEDLPEGKLAKLRASLVNRDELAAVARRLDVGSHLRLGRGEVSSGGREKSSILADAMEALIAAVYLDAGFDVAKRIVLDRWSDAIARRATAPGKHDYKTRLQELLAESGRRPVYRTEGEGPDHARTYRATVTVDGEALGTGAGGSKKQAEQAAAAEALNRMA